MIYFTHLIFLDKQKKYTLLVVFILCFILSTIGIDFLFTQFHGSAFYISESLLFSVSFWILFFPFLIIQSGYLKKSNKLAHHLLVTTSIAVFHIFLYPAIVWCISEILFIHTFPYWQTFNFGLSIYLIKIFLIYIFFYLAFVSSKKRSTLAVEKTSLEERFLQSITVPDQHNKKIIVHTNEVSCFSACSPYLLIYYQSKKYLYAETLKSLEDQLNPQYFVRIHKSHIVNLKKITSYQSRQNGDYDLNLADGITLRLSRNYSKDFKRKLHQLSMK